MNPILFYYVTLSAVFLFFKNIWKVVSKALFADGFF